MLNKFIMTIEDVDCIGHEILIHLDDDQYDILKALLNVADNEEPIITKLEE